MIYTNERSSQMKLKALAVAMAFITGAAQAGVRYTQEVQVDPIPHAPITAPVTVAPVVPQDGIRMIPVVRVDPIQHAESFSQTEYVCSPINVPVYQHVPVTSQVQNNSHAGLILGTIAGVALTKGTAQIGGAIVGGAIGHAIDSAPRTVTHGYTTQFVGYRQQQNCQAKSVPYERLVTIGYNVTYVDRGETKTITMGYHPGTHVRLRVTTRLE
jgi:uncharacterized protein YcfJ